MKEYHAHEDHDGGESSELPPMDPWDIVSDPFESPKVYRHKVPLIRNPADGKGVHLFVVDKPNVPPIALHDLGDNVVAPELRILVENEPIELGTVGRIPRPDGEGYLKLTSIAIVDVKIPPMGDATNMGLLASWLVKGGEAVRKGQALFTYETDKTTFEFNAEVDGKITITVQAGTEVLTNQVVASIEASAVGWTRYKHSMKNLDKIPKGLTAVPYRLKSPDNPQPGTTSAAKGPNYSLFLAPSALPPLRGVIDGESLLALRHAIMLAAYISK